MKTVTQRYRPITINQVSGQELAKNCLKAIVKNPDKSPRVIILAGTYGIGKTTLARAFARALNCKYKKDDDACGKCDTCLGNIDETPLYDEYDSSIIGNKEDIIELRETFDYTASEGWKVITIDEAQLISRQAQSTLLKVFEEISTRVFFVLCTTELNKILKTIISRSFVINLSPVDEKDLFNNLDRIRKIENINISDNDLKLIVRRSRGHVRNAHLMLQNYTLFDEDTFKESIKSAREKYIVFLIACFLNKKEKVEQCVGDLKRFPLTDLKVDYESLILEILKVKMGMEQPRDDLIEGLNQVIGGKALNLYHILNDNILYNAFKSDETLQSACYVIYMKIQKICK